MSTRSWAAGSPNPVLQFPETSSTRRQQVDPSTPSVEERFAKVAGLIDVVLGQEPALLAPQLSVLWDSKELETRTVLQLTIACRDPLAQLGSMCADSLQTRADLDRLVREQQWSDLSRVLHRSDVHACALLNLCESEIARLQGKPQARYKAIQQRLEAAAANERIRRGKDIRMLATLRDALCPNIWETFELWLDKL